MRLEVHVDPDDLALAGDPDHLLYEPPSDAPAPQIGVDRRIEQEGVDAAQQVVRCIGCDAPVSDIGGPTHPYIGASPGCWQVYGEVLAKEYGEYGYPPVHRLTVDAYAAQHPGTPSKQSIQSVAVHLIGLYAMFERGWDTARATRAIREAVARGGFSWLDPPPPGPLTIIDVRGAANLAEHTERVERWARSVWGSWAPHHETIRRWAGEGGRERGGTTDEVRRVRG